MDRSITHSTRSHDQASGIGWGLVAAAMVVGMLTIYVSFAMSASAGATGEPSHRSPRDKQDDDVGTTPGKGHGGEHKVTLCHATHSSTNPYVMITVDHHAVTIAGHGDHDGPVHTPTMDRRIRWGDVIPPFDLGGDAVYAGMNWTAEGQAIYSNDCNVPSDAGTTVPPTTIPPTTVATPAPTTTTTTTIEATTTTAATGGGSGAMTTTTAVVGGENVGRTPAAPVPVAEVRGISAERAKAPPASGSLPVTGATAVAMALIASALIGAGAMALAGGRRVDA